MNYEVVKGIMIDNTTKKIYIRSSANNIYPKLYNRKEYMKNCKSLKTKKKELFKSIMKGEMNLRICDNKNWVFAIEKTFEYCEKNNIDINEAFFNNKNNKLFNKLYEEFEIYYDRKYKGIYCLSCDYGYITDITHQKFFCTNDIKKVKKHLYSYKRAYIMLRKIDNYYLKKYNIKIENYDFIKADETVKEMEK